MRRHRNDRKGYAFRAWLWRLVPSEAWMVRIFHGLIAAAVCYMAYAFVYWTSRDRAVIDQCGVYATRQCTEAARKAFDENG